MSESNDRPERSERSELASGLGRGLGALIPQRGNAPASAVEILISRISPNPYQPRKHFSEEDLAKIEAKMKEIIATKATFKREKIERKDAIELFTKLGENLTRLEDAEVQAQCTGGSRQPLQYDGIG